jgi:hypothetical protein
LPGRGSWADMMVNIILAILERMEDHIQELLALKISTEEKKE